MRCIERLLFRACILLLIVPTYKLQGQVTITPNHNSGVYKSGETVVWSIEQADTITLDSVRYVLKEGGRTIVEHSMLSFTDNQTSVSYQFTKPGSILLEVKWGQEDSWRNKAVGGAIADPEDIKLSSKRPDDFKEFWNQKLNELESIPTNPVLERKSSNVDEIDYYHITMNNIRGSKIHGQLAMPSEGDKLPAMLIVQWAGVYGLNPDWVTYKAKDGWLVLNINAHDLPIDQPTEFYQEKSRGELKNYAAQGNDNPDSSYFLRMYLSCYRAAEYLANHPKWNGETLVVTGTSQGGQQTIMTAGFHPKITAAVALVPAGFDMLGPEMGRKGGWPQWYDQAEGKDPKKVHRASQYYDVANFAVDITCPVYVGVGLLDETCPPEGIVAGMNQVKENKVIMLLPNSRHQNQNGGQDAFNHLRDNVWFPSMLKGLELVSEEK